MLVSEMNSPTVGRSLTQHRKIAVNFRDASLYKVFQLALAALRHLRLNGTGLLVQLAHTWEPLARLPALESLELRWVTP